MYVGPSWNKKIIKNLSILGIYSTEQLTKYEITYWWQKKVSEISNSSDNENSKIEQLLILDTAKEELFEEFPEKILSNLNLYLEEKDEKSKEFQDRFLLKNFGKYSRDDLEKGIELYNIANKALNYSNYLESFIDYFNLSINKCPRIAGAYNNRGVLRAMINNDSDNLKIALKDLNDALNLEINDSLKTAIKNNIKILEKELTSEQKNKLEKLRYDFSSKSIKHKLIYYGDIYDYYLNNQEYELFYGGELETKSKKEKKSDRKIFRNKSTNIILLVVLGILTFPFGLIIGVILYLVYSWLNG
tara:strand:+ start:2917 stop:3822 length:906 start_codon:yes stop_codon:yes gene_type:complete